MMAYFEKKVLRSSRNDAVWAKQTVILSSDISLLTVIKTLPSDVPSMARGSNAIQRVKAAKFFKGNLSRRFQIPGL